MLAVLNSSETGGALSIHSLEPLIQKPQKALSRGALRNQLPNMVSTPETRLLSTATTAITNIDQVDQGGDILTWKNYFYAM